MLDLLISIVLSLGIQLNWADDSHLKMTNSEFQQVQASDEFQSAIKDGYSFQDHVTVLPDSDPINNETK